MDLDTFIKQFEAQLEDITPGTINADTDFRELPEWDSMTGLVIIAMIDREHGRQITGNDLVESKTVRDLYNRVKAGNQK
ncbi:acyl carrier protein [Chitinophaga ginsengisegetis]|uniref:acyl carrier protein n=1 Tax=Chitinophaga ginsengisegetis TaxID=393003 RepID=UPI0034164C75